MLSKKRQQHGSQQIRALRVDYRRSSMTGQELRRLLETKLKHLPDPYDRAVFLRWLEKRVRSTGDLELFRELLAYHVRLNAKAVRSL